MFPVAVLQGRLSPSLDGRFQFFPADWESEFPLAQQLGVALEWLADWPEIEAGTQPLLDPKGSLVVELASRHYRVPIVSICADYFMKHSPYSDSVIWRHVLKLLVSAATQTTNRVLLLPMLEDNAPLDVAQDRRIADNLAFIVPTLEQLKVKLAFETEMNRDRLTALVDSFASPYVGVYYDIGNCTSYGFDCPADIRVLNRRIMGVHVKDRKRGSAQSVVLGTGDADIRGSVEALASIGWRGHLVMQAWRGPETYLQDACGQITYLNDIQREVFSGA